LRSKRNDGPEEVKEMGTETIRGEISLARKENSSKIGIQLH